MLDAKQRLKATGVTGRKLAARLGVRDATVSDALRGRTAAPYVHAAIEALEIMTPDQRAAWLGASSAESPSGGNVPGGLRGR